MKRLSTFLLPLIFGAALCLAQHADSPDKARRAKTVRVSNVLGSPSYQILNINNITTWFRSDGQSNHAPSGDDGCRYPRGTAAVIYQDGIVWGGKPYLDPAFTTPVANQPIRVGGQTYSVGTRAGRVIGTGSTAVPADPGLPEVRIYRIRRDYAEVSDYEIRRDAGDYFEIPFQSVTSAQVAQVRMQYEKDWREWPVQYGAPYIERNGIPGYQPPPPFSLTFTAQSLIDRKYDEPGIAGADPDAPADQVIWTVYNDLDRTATVLFLGSEPLGLEVQVTLWAYKRYDALGNMYFKKVKFINKGGVDIGGGRKGSFWIDSMFIGQWSDPDVGDFADDLVGCDTLLNIGFAYNSKAVDKRFQNFNLPPPAIGYDYLQGPIVPGTPSDSGVFDLKKVRGKKNLPMTSFAYQLGLSPIPPPDPQYPRYWKMLQGYMPTPDTIAWRLYPHPPGVAPTKFPLSGDPVTQTGFVDGLGTRYSFEPGDRRFLMSSGPFRLAPGDTQEILIATVAGLGADHLSSISVMKHNDRAAKRAFRSLFDIARPPAVPNVQVAELDREIILEWGSDLKRVEQTERKVIAGEYVFEGYNVYQLPSAQARLEEGIKIATFDVTNDVGWIVDEVVDPTTGLLTPSVVQRGNNEGVRRFIQITRDRLTDPYGVRFQNNGQEYYFAVTSYNYSPRPFASPKSLESAPALLKVKPRIPFGVKLNSKHGDTLRVTHAQGSGVGAIYPIVINPLAGTGDTYEVRFDTTGGSLNWTVLNRTKSQVVIGGQRNLSGDSDYPIVEGGIYLKVVSKPPKLTSGDVFTYAVPIAETNLEIKKESARRVGVFPNPYVAGGSQESDPSRRFVTFNNLPPKAIIRIFNLAGHLVRVLSKDNPSQFLEWDLTNEHNWQVASGMYICQIEMPEINEVKILKLAVVQAQFFPPRY